MIKAKMYKQIQKLKRQGYLKGEVSAKLGLDPRTVAKYFGMSERAYKSYHQDKMFRNKELEKYEDKILEVYERNEYKRLNMSSVYDYLEEG